MKKAFKFFSGLLRWLVILIAAIVILWIAQQVFLKPIIETVATKIIGARVTMGSFSLDVLTQKVRITHFQIYNEEGFSSKIFFDAPEILVNVDIPQVIKGKFHFPLIVFSLNKMIVCKNAQGKMNVNELKIVQEKLHEKNKGPMPNFMIDELRLNIEQVIVEDDSKTPALIKAYDLNLKDKTFRNVNGVSKLVGLVMFEALKPTAIQSAGLYAASALLGVAFLPSLAIGVAIANDAAISDMPDPFGQLYQHCLDLIKRLGGQVKRANPQTGQISANVYDCDVSIEIHDEGWGKSKITIKARKFFLAKPEIAGGILYQLKDRSK